MTTHAPRFHTPDDEMAFRLGRYVDALITEDEFDPPAPPAPVSDLVTIARELMNAPRPESSEALHTRAKVILEEHAGALIQLTTLPYETRLTWISQNGVARPMTTPTRQTDTVSGRRLLPYLELVGLVAAILIFIYVAFGRNQSAPQPNNIASPVSSPGPTVTVDANESPTSALATVGDWPMRGGGPTHAGGPDRTIPDESPTERWTTTLPTGIRLPVAAGDALYVSNGGVVIALAADTGSERWRYELGVSPSVAGANPPAVVGKVVYVAAHDGTVVALDAITGTMRWSYETQGTITTSVAVASGTVIVGTVEGALYALDSATGTKRWSYQTGSISISSPVIAGERVFVGAGGNQIFALELATGMLAWKQSVKPGMQTLGVGDGIAIASGVNTSSAILLIALDPNSGNNLWQGQQPTDLPVAIVEGTAYVFSGGVTALDAKTGTNRWQFSATLKVIDYAVIDDSILLCRKDGTVIAIDATTGKERWRLPTGNAGSGVAVGAGTIYVAHSDGALTAYGT